MNIYTYIIGTGYLSNHLAQKINNSKVISAHNFITDIIATYDHSEGNYGTLIGGVLYDSAFISAICALGLNFNG